MKHLIITAGTCPLCGSPLTGRLRAGRDGHKALRLRAPIVFTSNPGEYNCACLSCGVFWRGDLKFELVEYSRVSLLQSEWIRVNRAGGVVLPKDQERIWEEVERDELISADLTKEEKKMRRKLRRENSVGGKFVSLVKDMVVTSVTEPFKMAGEMIGSVISYNKDAYDDEEDE